MFKQTKIMRTAMCFVAVVALASLAACSKQDGDGLLGATNTGADAPKLPAMSTMTMDLSFFGVDGTSTAQAKAMDEGMMLAAPGNKTNFINAVVRVLYIQLTLYDILEEPVGAFAAAIHSVPQPQPDGSYLWTFIFVDGANEYSIFLNGKVVGDHVEWRLEVSTNNPELVLDHFVWFSGESKLDDSGGYWQFYKPVASGAALATTGAGTDGAAVVRMDWENYGGAEHRLTVLANEVGGPDEGDMLVFHETPSTGTIDYYDAETLDDQNITWHVDGSGSLTVGGYNDGQQACWNTRQEDTVCP
jgi:hypothetical protein